MTREEMLYELREWFESLSEEELRADYRMIIQGEDPSEDEEEDEEE